MRFLDLLKPKTDLNHNGFDLSQRHVFSMVPGRLDSPFQLEVVPSDHARIDVLNLVRSMTLNTAAFIRGKFTFDFFFVPYSQLWHPFNQFISQRLDKHSTLQRGNKYVPNISLGKLLALICHIWQDSIMQDGTYDFGRQVDVHGLPWIVNTVRILDYCGYGNFNWLLKQLEANKDTYVQEPEVLESLVDSLLSRFEDKMVNVFRIAAYQHIWYDYYRNKFYDDYDYTADSPDDDLTEYIRYFNFDDIACTSAADSEIDIDYETIDANINDRIYGLFMQRYCQWKQDLIQSTLPSTQFGAVSEVTFDIPLNGSVGSAVYDRVPTPTSTFSESVSSGDRTLVAISGNSLVHGGLASSTVGQRFSVEPPHSHSLSSDIPDVGFDVLALKRAEALQKWRQNALRAGNMVDDAFNAHFGVKPRFESDNNVVKLGTFESSFQVNPIEATAATDNSVNGAVGDLAATGTAVTDGRSIEFDATDFGVIVCMAYFRPDAEYNSMMLDRANRLIEPFDFYTPEYQNVGLDAVVLSDYSLMRGRDGGDINSVIGFAPQYWWYKTALDKVHGDFVNAEIAALDDTAFITNFKGSLSPWVSPRRVEFMYNDSSYRMRKSLYVNPSILDNNFAATYQNPSDKIILTDQFVVNMFFSCKLVRPMSVLGLPQF